MPDLIGVGDRKYLDHTGTHANRGIGDLMRYAALVSYAESSTFGPHRMLAPEQQKIHGRLPDEAFYALALYLQSLQPPPNPNPIDERARAGQKVFAREGCPGQQFREGLAVALFRIPVASRSVLATAFGFDVAADGSRFLVPNRLPQSGWQWLRFSLKMAEEPRG